MASKLIIVALALCIIELLHNVDRPQRLPLVKADMPYRFTIKNPPLLRSPQGRLDYHPGVPFNDKGDA